MVITSYVWGLFLGNAIMNFSTKGVELVSSGTAGTKTMCSTDFYRDGETGKCQPCNELCHQAEVRGTVELCTRLCPDNSVPEDCVVTATTTSAAEAAVIAPIDDGNLIPEGVAITLAVVIILVSLAALVILLFFKRRAELCLGTEHDSKRSRKDTNRTCRLNVSSISAVL